MAVKSSVFCLPFRWLGAIRGVVAKIINHWGSYGTVCDPVPHGDGAIRSKISTGVNITDTYYPLPTVHLRRDINSRPSKSHFEFGQ